MQSKNLLVSLAALSLCLHISALSPCEARETRSVDSQWQAIVIACRITDDRNGGNPYRSASYVSEGSAGLPSDMAPYANDPYANVPYGNSMRPMHFHHGRLRNSAARWSPGGNVNSGMASSQRPYSPDPYQERARNLSASVDGLNSQMKRGTSNIQLSPVGTNLYVRNYVNYGSDEIQQQPVTELKAVAKSL